MRAWVLGDNVDTDAIAPGRYMKLGIEDIAKHCFESLLPGFALSVQKGDVIVAGRNFGAGSSREQAAEALKHLGIAALVAESFAGLFYRNALNVGLTALVCAGAKRVRDGETIEIDFEKAQIRLQSETLSFEPIPPHLMEMVRDGGLLAHLEKRLRCNTTS